jgi:hypothetical protein
LCLYHNYVTLGEYEVLEHPGIMLREDLDMIDEDDKNNGEISGTFHIHLKEEYETSIKKSYYSIRPDGLCWLRTFFHNKFGYDAILSSKKKNDKEKFIEYIKE